MFHDNWDSVVPDAHTSPSVGADIRRRTCLTTLKILKQRNQRLNTAYVLG
jgi:hypothetical protein